MKSRLFAGTSSGKAMYSKAPLMSWDVVCRPKDQGGLGVYDCVKWNIGAVGKLIWHIASRKDSLWKKWVDHVYLKGKTWKRFKCAKSISWNWKQIWWAKDQLKDGF